MKPGRWSAPLVSVSLLPLLGACAIGEGMGDSYERSSWGGSSSSSASSSSSSASSGSTTQSGSSAKSYTERTYLNRDGSVTIIQRDRDGTRTIVDSKGNVRVDPPGYGSGHRRR